MFVENYIESHNPVEIGSDDLIRKLRLVVTSFSPVSL